jgi:GT2 family glycosyltransferase
MDEKLFSPFYWEDVDLSYRALKRGFRLLWEPKAKVIHHHESTIGKISRKYRQRIQERNQLIFIWKNLTSPILFRKHVLGVFRRVSLHPGYLIIVLMALRKIKGVVKVRKREKKESKVSDEAIFARFG